MQVHKNMCIYLHISTEHNTNEDQNIQISSKISSVTQN